MAVNWAVSDLSGFSPRCVRLVEKAPAASRSCRGEGKKKTLTSPVLMFPLPDSF